MKESKKELALETMMWIVMSVVLGCLCGVVGFGFEKVLELVTDLRLEHGWLLYLLPAAGLLIIFMYHRLGVRVPRGTNRILASAQNGEEVALRVAPMIFVATALTHLTGGSAGREGAALQLGGSMANFIGRMCRRFRLGNPDLRVITMCGMAAGFSALFGTPLAASVFALEVTNNSIRYSAVLPCMLSSVIATITARAMGGGTTFFHMGAVPELGALVLAKCFLLAILVAWLAVLFVTVLHQSGKLYHRFLPNPYLRVLVGAALVIGITLLEGSGDYNGAGVQVINRAMDGSAVWYAFLLKMLMTAITLEAGFKGGEIVPTLFVGATFGCVISALFGLPAGFSAGFCMVTLFCGVTNCPLASIFLAGEIFGSSGIVICAVGCCVSYIFSGNFSLYTAQKINFSKFRLEE